MDFNLLAVFVKVVDKGSFTQAALALRQPKSRVSRNIAALEKRIGLPLLYRSTRQVSLTETGKALYQQAREHVYGLEGATESMHVEPGQVSGVLRLTAAEDLGTTLLGPFISDLTHHYPDLRVELHCSNQVVDLVKEGIDVAIRIDELDDTSLMSKKIGTISFIPVATPAYLKKSPPIKTVDDLTLHPALIFNPAREDDIWVLIKDGKHKKIRMKPLCKANNPKVLLDMALDGRGVALLPEFLCLELIKSKHLVRLLPEYSTEAAPVYFVWPPQKGQNPKLRACIDEGMKYLARFFR